LVGAQCLARLFEETDQILGVGGLLVLDQLGQLAQVALGVEVDGAHGALGAGIDLVELALGFGEGAAGALLAVVLLLGLAEVLAEHALEKAEVGLGFFAWSAGGGFKVFLQGGELLQRL